MSELSIRRVAIVGAGTVGSALAGHLTNLGFSVSLIDVTAQAASEGVDAVRSVLYIPERAAEIRTAGIVDAVTGIEEADWIIEALLEKADLKREFFAQIVNRIRPDAIVTTSSGSLSIDELAEGLPDSFTRRFMAAYFRLPIKERRLVEVRTGTDTDAALARSFCEFLTEQVARRAVFLPLAPAGIVARYGIWSLAFAAQVTEKLRLDVEEIEGIATTFLGRTSGIFRTIDGVGLDDLRDVVAHLQTSFHEDRGSRFLTLPDGFVGLLARGWTGDKTGRGFFRREGREHLVLNLATMAYVPAKEPSLPGLTAGLDLSPTERLKHALNVRDEVGEFLREYLVPCLQYADYLREQTGISSLEFDRVMEWGFGWARGPFKLLEDLGMSVIPADVDGGGFLRLEECPVIDRSSDTVTYDLGDGIQALLIHGGVLTGARIKHLLAQLESKSLGRFVLLSGSAGFPTLDLESLLGAFRGNDGSTASEYLADLQRLGETLEDRACVAALCGSCLGPWLGLALSCPVIVAEADIEVGFNEARLGLLPTARGLTMMRVLHGDSTRRMSEIAVSLTEGAIIPNADLARQTGYLRPTDVTEYLPERLLSTAKRIALTVSPFPQRSLPAIEGPLMGMIDRALTERKNRGNLTDHDVAIGQRIRQVIAKTLNYDECLERERLETIEMGSKALSQARIRHVFETGKPLRN